MKARQKEAIVNKITLLIRILLFLVLLCFTFPVSLLLSFLTVEFLGLEVLDHKPYSGSGPIENELNPLIWLLAFIYLLVPVYFYRRWKNK